MQPGRVMEETLKLPERTQEMDEIFIKRSCLHIQLVKKNLLQMAGYLSLTVKELTERAINHDKSKFNEPERTAYTWITWMYHCKQQGVNLTYPEGIEELVMLGWKHHITTNLHHPEAHADPNLMTLLDLVEMVCDWNAIHQELKLNYTEGFAWINEALSTKWGFTSAKQGLIFTLYKELAIRNNINLNRLN